MSEQLPSESPQSFSREAAQQVVKAAAAQGPVDPDVEQFLRGIIEGAPKRQIEAALGQEKHQEVRARVLAYAQKLERS